jgi:subtilase family serine protease
VLQLFRRGPVRRRPTGRRAVVALVGAAVLSVAGYGPAPATALPAIQPTAIPAESSWASSSAATPSAAHTRVVDLGLARQVKARRATGGSLLRPMLAGPISPSECLARYHEVCYGPPQLRPAYGLNPLPADDAGRHSDGAGTTIAVLISYGNPHIQADLDTFSAAYGLPSAPVETLHYGNVPPFDPSDFNQLISAAETDLDVQYIHTIAPKARILVVATGSYQTEGTGGMTDLMDAMRWLVGHRRDVDAISMSWGTYEADFAEQAGKPGDYRLMNSLQYGLKAAHDHHVTLIAATGDTGATGPNLAGTALYSFPTVAWPAGSPLVTAVGGTQLHLDDAGHRTAPDTLWIDDGQGVASGGGLSQVFPRPAYQDQHRQLIGEHRAIPDVSMDGSIRSQAWVYFGAGDPFDPAATPGWDYVAGTSLSAPLFAGVVALAAGKAGHPLGDLHQTLYRLRGARSGLLDVTSGCNTNTIAQVTGYCASPGGWDVPSGIGTVGDANRLADALAHHR